MKSAAASTPKIELDRCDRCGGLVVSERFYDWMSDSGSLDFEGLRCLVCGEIVDPLILVHRRQRPEPEDHHRYLRRGMRVRHG